MRVIGVDPGIVVTGFGIIDKKNNNIDLAIVMVRLSLLRICIYRID